MTLERIEDENLSKKLMNCREMPCGKNALRMGPTKRNIWDKIVVSSFPPLKIYRIAESNTFNPLKTSVLNTMLSILRKARLKDKEMRILMLSVV